MRLTASVVSMVIGLVLSVLATSDTATATVDCVSGCSNGNISVSPHGGELGTFHNPGTISINWTVTNNGSTVADVSFLAGATGCAKKVAPYVSKPELYLEAHESIVVQTYVTKQCVGAGTVYASAGQDQGYQTIHFT